MRNKRIIAAVSGVALSGVLATGTLAAASAAPAKSHTPVHAVSQVTSLDAAKTRAMSDLGGLSRAVDGLTRSAAEKAAPSPAMLKQRLAKVRSAADMLTKDTTTAMRHGRVLPANGHHPDGLLPVLPTALVTAVTQLLTDAGQLVSDLTAANVSAVVKDLTAVVKDLTAVLDALLSALLGLLPTS